MLIVITQPIRLLQGKVGQGAVAQPRLTADIRPQIAVGRPRTI